MYLVKTPYPIRTFAKRNFTWCIDTHEKVIFLTFDDGPIPQTTPFVLNTLAKYGAKATFFCVGDNIRKYPELYQQIINQNHVVGNHTFNHLNGWKTHTSTYLDNVEKCDELIHTKLFRPPYGKLKPSQIFKIKQKHKIILWSVLSGDFDQTISSEKCYQNVVQHAREGSIVVFHDNLKAKKHIEYVLPLFLEHFHKKGYQFKAITEQYLVEPYPVIAKINKGGKRAIRLFAGQVLQIKNRLAMTK